VSFLGFYVIGTVFIFVEIVIGLYNGAVLGTKTGVRDGRKIAKVRNAWKLIFKVASGKKETEGEIEHWVQSFFGGRGNVWRCG
jgi:hypothetical protein